MGLETATYINGLVATNPVPLDPKNQGDDHLRLLKSAIKNTFPAITGQVTASHTQLNAVVSPGVLCPPGMIAMWSGSTASIPSGWALCNGTGTTAAGAIPDLRNRFIVGAGSTYAVGANGGATTHTHSLTVNVGATALTVDQLPAHTHTVPGSTSSGGGSTTFDGNSTGTSFTIQSSSVGSGATHTHTGSGTAVASSNLPPYYALAYIIKL